MEVGYNLLKWIFVLCGGKLYMDWLLITNPSTKNPLIRTLFRSIHSDWHGRDYKSRYRTAILLGGIHAIGAVVYFIMGDLFNIVNIFINLYPSVVQLWIGYRCWRIKKIKTAIRLTTIPQTVLQ